MEVSDPKIRKFVVFLEMEPCTFCPQPQSFSLKKFIVFFSQKTCSEMERNIQSSAIIKLFFYLRKAIFRPLA